MPLKLLERKSIGRADKPPNIYLLPLAILLCVISGFCWSGLHAHNLHWRQTIFSVLAVMAWVSILSSLLRLAACLSPKPKAFAPNTVTQDLPHYTVLVPIFKEANMVKSLMQALSAIEYAPNKIQILLICKAVDPKTIAAVKFYIRHPFELIIVPKGTPQTKPRALNYAMKYARGEFITIYDAEDRPHPGQLLTALSAFKANSNWAALQAPLDYFNANHNWLTEQFGLEYASLVPVIWT